MKHQILQLRHYIFITTAPAALGFFVSVEKEVSLLKEMVSFSPLCLLSRTRCYRDDLKIYRNTTKALLEHSFSLPDTMCSVISFSFTAVHCMLLHFAWFCQD